MPNIADQTIKDSLPTWADAVISRRSTAIKRATFRSKSAALSIAPQHPMEEMRSDALASLSSSSDRPSPAFADGSKI